MTQCRFFFPLGLCCALLAVPPASRAETQPLSETERFRLEDRYRIGNYLAMGGLFTEAVAALTHDRGLALGFYGAATAMRFAGLPIMASAAGALCREGGTGSCDRRGYAYFAVSAAAEAALAGELYALDYDRRHGASRSLSHWAGAYTAAGVSTAAYVISWYLFRDLHARGADEERVSWGVLPVYGGASLSLRFAFGGHG
jgi:hypothetical protein